MKRVALLGLVVLLGWVLAEPALGQPASARQPFQMSVDSQVEMTSELPGPRIERTVAGILEYPGFKGEVTGTYVIIDLAGPCGNKGRLVSSLVICPVDLDLSSEISPGSLLTLKCSVVGTGATIDDLSLAGRCVVTAADQGVHGSGELEGSFDATGGLTFTLDGTAKCTSFDPKLCPFG